MATYRPISPVRANLSAMDSSTYHASKGETVAQRIIATAAEQDRARRVNDARLANPRYTAFVEGRYKLIR